MDSVHTDIFRQFPYARLVLAVDDARQLSLYACNDVAARLYGMHAGVQPKGKQLYHVLTPEVADFITTSCQHCLDTHKLWVAPPAKLHNLSDAAQSFTFSPVVDREGHITFIDVTALPFEADKLALQKERDHALMLMTAAFDASNLGIFVTDRDRRIIRVNEAFLREYEFRRRDLIGHDFTHLYVPSDRRMAMKSYKNYLQGHRDTRHEWRLQRPNGTLADVVVTNAPLHLHGDRPLVVHTFVDISEHRNLEESLRWAKEQADAANRAKSAFLAGMSHELRTPLNAIIGFSEMVKSEMFGPLGHTKYGEYIHDIHFAAGNLLAIINDILDMSKIEAGKFEIQEEDVEIDALFESIVRMMTARASKNNITLETRRTPQIQKLYVDKRVLRQMLLNLVSNAIKYSPDGDVVTIVVDKNQATEEIRLSVRDNGSGITPEDLARVMEPFNQGSAAINDGSGTGLGLPLTRAMAELHGGTIAVESVVGRGTCVTIILPLSRLSRKKQTPKTNESKTRALL